jgi:hypothetical protein
MKLISTYANVPKNRPGDEHCDGWLNISYIMRLATIKHRISMEYLTWETKAIKSEPFYPPEIPHHRNQHPIT